MPSPSKHIEDLAEARVGTTIQGKYRLERLIGIGGMAAVYAGSHRNGNRVALKVLHPELGIDADVRGRFLREGYVANKVDHSGAVRVLDDDATEDGAVFLVMELLEGEGVDARWERSGRRLAVEEVCAIAQRLLGVLAAAHAKSVIHRDIKPENLFLTVDGAVKVLDFGIARLRERDPGMHTATGRTMGTPAYMPPEQARGRRTEVDERTDLWAVGATMFTLLSAQYVHQAAETTEELLVFTATQPVQSLLRVAPEVPAAIAAVVDKALAFARLERWSSALEMGVALEDAFFLAYGRPLAAVSISPAPASSTRRAETRGPDSHDAVTQPNSKLAAGAAMPRSGPDPDDTQPASIVRVPDPKLAANASTIAGLSHDGGPRSLRRRSTVVALAAAAVFLAVVGLAGVGLSRHGAQGSTAIAGLGSAAGAATPDSAALMGDGKESQGSSPAPPPTGTAGGADAPLELTAVSLERATRPVTPPRVRTDRVPRPTPSASAGDDCPLESYVETVKGEPVTRFRRACR